VLGRLQHVFGGQRSSGPVTQGKRILQKRQDLGFRLDVLRTVSVLKVWGQLVAGEWRPDEIVGGRDVLPCTANIAHPYVATKGSSSLERS
jgi:hypothetical protein